MTIKVISDQQEGLILNLLMNWLKKLSFSEIKRYIAITFDEMKIQENIVWDKHSGELIGFFDLGDININYATLENVQKLATQVLVFLVKSVMNPLSYSFATLATDGITAFQIMPVFWKALKYLERINLKVIAATADESLQNRIILECINYFCGDSEADVIYRTKNIHTKICFLFTLSQMPQIW